MHQRSLSLYGGVFFTAMSVLLFEISLTRVFAVMMWHHFAPVLVSLALLGFGASGSLLTALRESERRDDPRRRLGWYATLYGVTVILGFCFVTLIKVDTLNIKEPANLIALLFCYLVVSVPFLLGGLAIGTTLTLYSENVGRIYFVDLLGSGLGAGIAVLFLEKAGAVPAVMCAGTLGILGGTCFAAKTGLFRTVFQVALLAGGVALVVGFLGGAYFIPAMSWDVPFAPGKDLSSFPGGRAETTIPSSVAQVDISAPIPLIMATPGNFGDVDFQDRVMLRGVTQDGTAPTLMYEQASDLSRYPSLDDTQAASAYIAQKAKGLKNPDVMVIGVGGGADVMVALFNGARAVTAVELNTAMVRMVEKDYADYIGRLFEDKRVRLINSEGRSFARSHDDLYDVIQLSGVDTYTALAKGAFTLGESYLYTVEAIQDFYGHLNDGGIINYSRRLLRYPERPRETIRLANTVREALVRLGIPDAHRHVCILQGQGWASTMIRKGPFTPEEIQSLKDWAAREGFMGLAFDPLREAKDPVEPGRLRATDYGTWAAPLHAQVFGLIPQAEQGAMHGPLRNALIEILRAGIEPTMARSDALIDTLVSGLPARDPKSQGAAALIRRERDRIVAEIDRSLLQDFRTVQAHFTTLLRGEGQERAAFIEEYPFDLSPSTDDRPFFFDYFKFSKFFEQASGKITGGWHPDFPVGHWVLMVSMVQIVVLAVVLILLPVRHLRRSGVRTRHRFRYLIYFSGLGVGFMFLEIGLMQKLVLFLGNPIYSLSVVLGGLLVASGLGALFTHRIEAVTRGTLLSVMLAILACVGLDVLVVNHVLTPLLGLALWVRIGFTLLLVAINGFFLGMAFPLGVRVLRSRDPVLIPWGWAVNGFLSVFSSLLAIVVAMGLGFTWTLTIAGAIYLVGFLVMVPEERTPVRTT